MLKGLPWAITVVMGIVLVPIAIRTMFYFVLAPIASRRPPIALVPQSAGAIEDVIDTGRSGTEPVSSVSRAITIDASNELLVHPEFLQSSPHGSRNDTKWLLRTMSRSLLNAAG